MTHRYTQKNAWVICMSLPWQENTTLSFKTSASANYETLDTRKRHPLLHLWVVKQLLPKRIFSQEGDSQPFPLVEDENLIGRKSVCDIVINSNQVSRRHAVLTLKNGRFFIRDEQSKNETFLEKKAIQETAEIRINVKIRFGKIEAKLILKEG